MSDVTTDEPVDGQGPKTFRRTDRTDAPLYLARYTARTKARAPGPAADDDAGTPLYLRRFRERQVGTPAPTRSVPLEFEGERFSP